MTRAVDEVLDEIGAGESPRLLVLNKADLLDEDRRHELAFRHPEGLLVSAVTGEGMAELGEAIAESFERSLTDVELLVPFSEGQTLSELHDVAGDLEREDTAEGVRYRNHAARNAALPHWLEHYNERRPHSGIGGHPPISRAHNLSGQDS